MRSRYVAVTRRGGSEVLELCERFVPSAQEPGQALVRVAAAGVSYGDVLLRAGVIPGGPRPPFTPGFEVAGVVEAAGVNSCGIRPGQAVAALTRSGGYADLLTLPADRLVPVPAGADLVEAAAVVLNYFVAYQMLHRIARVQRGQHVLAHGAAGGVGTAILQLGKLAGAVVHGTASAAKHDLVRRLGGQPIDYRAQDFVAVVRSRTGGTGVAAVFDPIGGNHFRHSYRALARGGIMIGYGQSSALRNGKRRPQAGAWGMLGGIALPKLIPGSRSATFYNAWRLESGQPQAYREDLGAILGLLASRQIEPVIADRLPLADAARAHELLENAAVSGKIVLICGAAQPPSA